MKRIIFQNESGGVSVIIPTGELPIEKSRLRMSPKVSPTKSSRPTKCQADRFFRGAWVTGDCCIDVDLDKCKAIGHDKRRAARAEEFKPYDEVIAKQIPGVDAAEAEAARQAIRDKYAAVQDAVNAAKTPDAIKVALEVN
jgi:hypothetical protein